jgi:uracil phosphoribosyltransferase
MRMPALPSKVTVIDHPLVRVKLTRLRDQRTGLEDFRGRLEEVAAMLAFEATRDLSTRPDSIRTPLATHEGAELARPVIVVPILRAGTGMAGGMLPFLPGASIGQIGMRRDEKTHLAECYYVNVPANLGAADVIVVDPMLATGHSAAGAIAKLKESGAKHIRFICCVSCPEGLAFLSAAHPDVAIFTGCVDPGLDERAYIVPGLGDAGDRYFGTLPPDGRAAE